MCLLLLALVLLAAGIGCGSPSTDPTEAAAIAAAEDEFLRKWRHAEAATAKQCGDRQRGNSDACYDRIARRQQRAAIEFAEFIRDVREQGVGPECDDALEGALYSTNSVPFFLGEATAVCRAESRQ